jgi:Flp pilus assembly pilin Flp
MLVEIVGKIKRLWRSEEGPTATEYAVLIAVICVAVIGALSSFGVHMDNLYTSINSTVPVAGP